jgi:hypothetical protein
VTFSSKKSGCCNRVNSIANPPSTWRTTRPGVFPSVIKAPIGGIVSLAIPAPKSDRSTIRQVTEVPFGMVMVERALLGTKRSGGGPPAGRGCGGWRAKLVALARRCRDRHGETGGEHTRDCAFEPAEVIDIGDHALPRLAGHRRLNGDIARRHVDDLAGEFPPVREHVASQQVDAHALKPASLVIEWEDVEKFLQHGSGALFADPRSL